MFNLFRMRIAFLLGFCFFALTRAPLTRATTLTSKEPLPTPKKPLPWNSLPY